MHLLGLIGVIALGASSDFENALYKRAVSDLYVTHRTEVDAYASQHFSELPEDAGKTKVFLALLRAAAADRQEWIMWVDGKTPAQIRELVQQPGIDTRVDAAVQMAYKEASHRTNRRRLTLAGAGLVLVVVGYAIKAVWKKRVESGTGE